MMKSKSLFKEFNWVELLSKVLYITYLVFIMFRSLVEIYLLHTLKKIHDRFLVKKSTLKQFLC